MVVCGSGLDVDTLLDGFGLEKVDFSRNHGRGDGNPLIFGVQDDQGRGPCPGHRELQRWW